MATYDEIKMYVKAKYGYSPKSCWIADVKEQAGLPVRRSWNRASDERKNPCPRQKVDAIMNALRYFRMI